MYGRDFDGADEIDEVPYNPSDRAMSDAIGSDLIEDFVSLREEVTDFQMAKQVDEVLLIIENQIDSRNEALALSIDNNSNRFSGLVSKIVFMTVQGFTDKEIVDKLSLITNRTITKGMITRLKGSQLFRDIRGTMLRTELEASATYLSALTLKATKTMADLLDSSNEKVRFQAAKDILNRVGLSAADKAVTENEVAADKTEAATHEQVAQLQNGMEEILKSLGRSKHIVQESPIDVDFDETGMGDDF